jgi:hypothetical protein
MLTEPREALPRSSTFRRAPGKPARLDLTTMHHGISQPVFTHAIYTRRGDVLHYCVAPPGKPRPTAFVTQHGDQRTLVTLRRTTAASGSGVTSGDGQVAFGRQPRGFQGAGGLP